MKKIACVFCFLLFAVCAATAQTSPPYNGVTIYYYGNMTRTQFDNISQNDIQRSLQNVNHIIYKSFWEIKTWDYEDDTMINWVHQNRILPGTSNNRQNGDVWELYVDRYETDGWYILVRWSYDDGYTYILYYFDEN